MKTANILLGGCLVLVFFVVWLFVPACKYEVAEPLWYREHEELPIPKINSVSPSHATAGVNYITIYGEKLEGALDTMRIYNPTLDTNMAFSYSAVYFSGTPVDIKNITSNSITVYRPRLVADSCIITIVPRKALVPATYSYGRIEAVASSFGDFVEAIPLSTLAVDNNENLYVCEQNTNWRMWVVSPSNVKRQFTFSGSTTRRIMTDMKITNDFKYLCCFSNNSLREIQRVDLSTGATARYTQMPSPRIVTVGDFDTQGYLYVGGSKTDLCSIPPNPPSSLTAAQIRTAGTYTTDDILTINVCRVGTVDYVYVAARQSATTLPIKIYRHQLTGSGTMGQRELVLDLAGTPFSNRKVTGIHVSSSGKLFLLTDAPNPLLVYDGTSIDYFYKEILPPRGRHSVWGRSNSLYMVSYDSTTADPAKLWNVIKINMGETGF
ncbi:MAG: hypothetical protein N3A63_09415 [Bacteroidetes bacterium]|nr:hypothetical protein [Bacteroidota bacterium]